MKDLHLSTIIVALLAIVMMFIIPTYNTLNKLERLIENSVEYYTEMFSDTIKSSGKVTDMVFEQFTHQLDQTGYLFEISIEHRKKIVLPNYSESGVFLGTYTTYYETYHIEDILDAVYDTGEYKLSFGDFVTVTVRSREAKRSAGIVSMLLGRGSSLADHITYTDGGLIWNEAY